MIRFRSGARKLFQVMDKSSFLIGILLITGGFALMIWQGKQQEEYAERMRQWEAAQAEQAAEAARADEAPETDLPRGSGFGLEASSGAEGAGEGSALDRLAAEAETVEAEPLATKRAPAEVAERVTLSNGWIAVDFTSKGAAIEQVRFVRTRKGRDDPFIFNEFGKVPALTLSVGEPDSPAALFQSNFQILEQSGTRIRFGKALPNGLEIVREYELSIDEGEGDPYVVSHVTSLRNATGKLLPGNLDFYFSLGAAGPLMTDRAGQYTNFGYFAGGEDTFINAKKFEPSSGIVAGIGAREGTAFMKGSGAISWAAVKNQYFAGVLTPKIAGTAWWAEAVAVRPEDGRFANMKHSNAISGYLGADVPSLGNGEQFDFVASFYVGPKEYRRLNDLHGGQDAVMEFGFFGFFSKILLFFLYSIHAIIPNWGWSIVVMTIIIKLLFWPLTAKAAQSQKRMQKIQGPLKEIAEKYKDNPDKKNRETLKLFREARVNPAAGCLPILIQFPIFIGLFMMLRTASELRYAEFLWISDLSRPDTIFEIVGFPVNLMPLIMGVTMFFQMRMMPTMANADPVQQKIFKFLPFVFLIFLYNFGSGLVVYWTVQNLLTILQQWITNRRKDEPEVEVLPPVKKSAKSAKGQR